MKQKASMAWRDWSHNPRTSRKFHSGMRIKDKQGYLTMEGRIFPVYVTQVHIIGRYMQGYATVNGQAVRVKAPYTARSVCNWKVEAA